jgi:Pao retrotransposon peptidase
MSGPNVSVINLHGFCDASTAAYGCCAYIQCEKNDNRTSHLLCAKSQVAPLKIVTIPHLKFCSAVLLAELVTGDKDKESDKDVRVP